MAPGARLPVAVSISHAEGRALSAAAWTGAGGRWALGIDLALVEPRSPEFLATFLTDEERGFVAGGAAGARAWRANLVWCAKEAVLKALGVGLAADTFDLTCLPGRDAAGSGAPTIADGAGWLPFVARCGPALVRGGETIGGAWRAFPDRFVGALAWRTGGSTS